jgi:hypothetical protein
MSITENSSSASYGDTPAFSRRVFLARAGRGGVVAVTALHSLVATAGVKEELLKLAGQAPALRIALIDVSASPAQSDPKGLYRDAARGFLNIAEPGDDLLIASMGDRGMDSFVAESIHLNRSGRKFEDRKSRHDGLERATAAMERLLSGPVAGSSRLLETLAALQPIAAAALAKGRAVHLYMATDGMENSRLASFEDLKFTDAKADALLARLVQSRLLMSTPEAVTASRSEVVVSVVGAGGASPEAWQRNKRFWEQYFAACGARLAFYGRSVPRFG